MEEWRHSSTILDLGTRWRYVVDDGFEMKNVSEDPS
jgi:hypothetical protein